MRGYVWLALVATLLGGCSDDSTTVQCGDEAERRVVEELEFCVYQRAVVIEEGFLCPADMVLYADLDADLAVCGPEGHEDQASELITEERMSSTWVITEPDEVPTYREDVAPVFTARCGACHQPDGPLLNLHNYNDAAANAELISSVVADGTMPAWSVRTDGTCGEFDHAAPLSAAEKEILTDWVAGGAPQGPTTATLPELPDFVADVEALAADVSMPAGETRCFVIETAPTATIVAGRAIVTAGVDAMALLSLDATDTTTVLAADAADPARGFECESAQTWQRRLSWGFTPGPRVVRLPSPLGVQLNAGEQLVLRVTARDAIEGASIGFELERGDASTFVHATLAEARDLVLPAGETGAENYTELPAADVLDGGGVRVYGVWPSQRNRLTSMRVEAGNDCLMERRPSAFLDWTAPLFGDTPVQIAADSSIELTCSFDTSEDSSAVRSGPLRDDELCRVALIVEDL